MKKEQNTTPTIRDIVKMTGLSIGTVSNYLNGKAVKSNNKVKIEEAIAKLGYIVNEHARGLARGETKIIGIIIPSFSNTFYGDLASEINKKLELEDYSVILNEHNFDVEKEKKVINSMLVRRVDGIIVVPASRDSNYYKTLDSNKVIFIDKYVEGLDCFDFVVLDNRKAGELACHEFVKHGHKQVAIIYNNWNSFTGRERYEGFVDFANKNNIKVDAYTYDERVESAYQQVQEIMNKNKYTGVFASNYVSTLSTIFYMNEKDIKVPNDVSVIGFDDIMLTRLFKPRLTILDQPLHLIAEATVNSLLNRMSTPKETGKITTIDPVLTLGESVKKI